MRPVHRLLLLALAAVACALALAGPAQAQTIWAVGDGGDGDSMDDALAARIQGSGVDKFLYLGDVYETGTAQEFADYYDPGFGRMKAITAPTPGNHEWNNRAEGYDPYWGPAFRQPNGGYYYSFDFAGFHFVSLNSEENSTAESAQVAWLRRDLARYPGTCTIAFWHRPRYSAGPQWNTTSMEAPWRALSGHAVVVLSGHAHNYQRHKPNRGLTQFVVGTGGHDLSYPDGFDPRIAKSFGGVVGALRIRLVLGALSYEFIGDTGQVLDSGLIECKPHGPAPARVSVTRPRNGSAYRAVRTLSGSSQNARRLSFSLIRRTGKKCDVWNGSRLVRASCKSRKSTLFASAPRWKAKLPGTLPAGAYRLTVTARAIDGTLARRVSRFQVGRKRR
jgi:calcineurin-like phosphoesterase family protein